MIKQAGQALGFTLIEMAIVLVVIGLVISGGIVAVGPAIESSKISETNQRLDRVEQALILHVIRYGCLPCPAATISVTSTAADAGQALAGAAYLSGCDSDACDLTQGAVPWRNLDLSEADVTDGFGMRLSYSLATGLQQSASMERTLPSSYPTGDLQVTTTAAAPTDITTTAAYVLISHGPNRSFGYFAGTGSQVTGTTGSTAETTNGTAGEPFTQGEYIPTQGTDYYDDIVRWRSAPMLIQLCGTNACGNPA